MDFAPVETLVAKPRKHSRLTWDVTLQAVHIFLKVTPIQCFSIAALQEFRSFLTAIAEFQRGTVKQVVVRSDVPGVFNFGGDLTLFVLLARAKAIDGLRMYGRLCVELVHWFEMAAERDIHTLALVQGDALGGGLECVLPIHKVIVERGAVAGFPEALFNLYPGMGAWNFTARRCGTRVATDMVLSGKSYGADELRALGIADVVADEGTGAGILEHEMQKAAPRLRGTLAALRIRSRMQPVTLEMLQVIVDDWAESALNLADRDMRLMERLARAQLKKVGGAEHGAVEEIKRIEFEEALAADKAAQAAFGRSDEPTPALLAA